MCLQAPFQHALAFWLLVSSVVCDGLDGVLTGTSGTNTAAGSFTDLVCDISVVAFWVAGLARNDLIHPALAVLFISTYLALALFLILHRLLHVSSRSILRPSRLIFFATNADHTMDRAENRSFVQASLRRAGVELSAGDPVQGER